MDSQVTGLVVFIVGVAMLVIGLVWIHQANVDDEEGEPGHKVLYINGIVMTVLAFVIGILGIIFALGSIEIKGNVKCKACDHDNPNGSAYCNKCGRPIPPDTTETME